jgi:hypothetical protein
MKQRNATERAQSAKNASSDDLMIERVVDTSHQFFLS